MPHSRLPAGHSSRTSRSHDGDDPQQRRQHHDPVESETFPSREDGDGDRGEQIALGLAAVAFICGLIYFLGHVNKEEEIHITQ